MDDSDEFDDPAVSLEISDDGVVYTLKIFSERGRVIDEPEFILAVEAWLHEYSQSRLALSDPGTLVH